MQQKKLMCGKIIFTVMQIECLTNYHCSCFFEENDYDETAFDDFCRQCLCYALKAVSYLLYNLFLEEKCN